MHDNKLFDIVFKMCCDLQVADELVHEFSDPEKHLSPTDQVGLYLGKWFFLLDNACSQKIPIAPPPPGILWRDIGERAIYIYSHNTLKSCFLHIWSGIGRILCLTLHVLENVLIMVFAEDLWTK